MILVAADIKARLSIPAFGLHPNSSYTWDLRKRLVIEPYMTKKVVAFGMSYGLSHAGYDVRVALSKPLVMKPGDFQLVTTVERLEIPLDIMMILHDKSTWARRGLAVQNTCFEPGWKGFPTLELSNHGPETLTLEDGMPIAQCVFHQLSGFAEGYAGKYQDQPQEAIPAKSET